MDLDAGWEARLDAYTDGLAAALRSAGWCGSTEAMGRYCLGLLLPGERKSMEPMAARIDPEHVQAQFSSLQRLITDSVWDHQAVLDAVRNFCLPQILTQGRLEAWIADGTTFPKQGTHSVGVAHQYCGNLGKTCNCQEAVSISLANHFAGLPVAYRLYLPQEWTDDPVRCKTAGIPLDVVFRKKWEIALDLADHLLAQGIPQAPFLADAAYGDATVFRDGLTERGFLYALGISRNITVWPPGWTPLPPPPKRPQRGRPHWQMQPDPDHPALRVDAIALALPPEAWQEVEWRQGTRGSMQSRFAAIRVRSAHGRGGKQVVHRIPDEEWLLVEWPTEESKPTRYWLSTMPANIPIRDLVCLAKLRWRIEQDYEDLKQDVGLGDFEGRTWRGFHHHASLSIASYGFLAAERARLFPPRPRTSTGFPKPAIPEGRPWRSPPTKGRAS